MVGYVYMMTNKQNTVLYTGVTNNLARRVWQHKNGKGGVFTTKYKTHKLVWTQECYNIQDAITAEKHIKAGSREKKNQLIAELNPTWSDLMKEE